VSEVKGHFEGQMTKQVYRRVESLSEIHVVEAEEVIPLHNFVRFKPHDQCFGVRTYL
jgi:hypothetical protein